MNRKKRPSIPQPAGISVFSMQKPSSARTNPTVIVPSGKLIRVIEEREKIKESKV